MGKRFTSDYQPNNKGKPKGAVTRTTCIRKAIFNLFDNPQNESLEDFMQNLKQNEPVEFAKIMTKLAPQKIESDNKNQSSLTVTFVASDSPKDDIE